MDVLNSFSLSDFSSYLARDASSRSRRLQNLLNDILILDREVSIGWRTLQDELSDNWPLK